MSGCDPMDGETDQSNTCVDAGSDFLRLTHKSVTELSPKVLFLFFRFFLLQKTKIPKVKYNHKLLFIGCSGLPA